MVTRYIKPMTVITRRSKLPQTIPMTPVDVDGVKYVVSVRGETEWVKNVRANPQIKLTKSGATGYVATEIPVEARKRILEAYKATASKATHRLFRQLPEDADHPVFALTPLSQPSCRSQPSRVATSRASQRSNCTCPPHVPGGVE